MEEERKRRMMRPRSRSTIDERQEVQGPDKTKDEDAARRDGTVRYVQEKFERRRKVGE